MRACSPPALLETITPGQLSQLDRQRPQPDAGAVGKLVTDATWYFVCAMGEEEAGRLYRGPHRHCPLLPGLVGRGGHEGGAGRETPENGRVTVVLSSDRYLSETTLSESRQWSWSLTVRPASAVPTQAVRVEERTVTDPETEEESRSWSPACTSWWASRQSLSPSPSWPSWSDFALVKSADGLTAEPLRAGDEVILSSVELFDGKVITQS